MSSDRNQEAMATDESTESASGRKRRGRVTALDEFLLNRVAKLQHKADRSSPDPHSARSDMESTPRTALRTVDTNIGMGKILQSSSDGKNTTPDVMSGESRKRSRGPGVNKMINQMEKENQPANENPQGTKRRGRGLGIKTLAKQKLAQESQNTPNQGSLTMLGSATPRSTVTVQSSSGAGNRSQSGEYNLTSKQDMVRHTVSNTNSSTVLHQINSNDCHRPLRPSTGASTSGVKNLLNEFDDVIDPSDFVDEDIMHGSVSTNYKHIIRDRDFQHHPLIYNEY
ncbi:hypothetical protein ACET3Z_021284 [Daucus carota]